MHLKISYKIFFGKLTFDLESITIFSVAKNHSAAEYIKLEWIKQIGLSHMRILEGATSLLQLTCLVAKLCNVVLNANDA